MQTTLDSSKFKLVDNKLTKIDKLDEFSERLLARRNINEDGCWEYTGHIMATGYGQINRYGVRLTTNKASYLHFIGDIPKGLLVSQRCHNRACFNPVHLVLSTRAGNYIEKDKTK
jgi:hypothetical protein